MSDDHAQVGAWFLGPRAENFQLVSSMFNEVLTDQAAARQNLYSSDPVSITPAMQASTAFTQEISLLQARLKAISAALSTHTVPFWSPRYNAHMLMENSFPAVLGCKTIISFLLLVINIANYKRHHRPSL